MLSCRASAKPISLLYIVMESARTTGCMYACMRSYHTAAHARACAWACLLAHDMSCSILLHGMPHGSEPVRHLTLIGNWVLGSATGLLKMGPAVGVLLLLLPLPEQNQSLMVHSVFCLVPSL
jgi:hypothetical protein